MSKKKTTTQDRDRNSPPRDIALSRHHADIVNPARIYAIQQDSRHLDPTQLARLEEEFRSWSAAASRTDVRDSRKRILLIFLLIRYTGARLNEVLALDPVRDFDASLCVVHYAKARLAEKSVPREVQISSDLMAEVQATLRGMTLGGEPGSWLAVDAAHVRRKFYERSVACGFAQDLGSPNAIRRARAVELMHSNVPLPVVQRILGHSTPNLTAAFVAFSDQDIHAVSRHFMERESQRRTSARNTFFGKISDIRRGDIQSRVELMTVGGNVVTTVITNDSLTRMGLKEGSLVTAEVKAPWVLVQRARTEPLCTAENAFRGTVTHVVRGSLTTEITVRIQDGTELCSVVTEESRRRLDLRDTDTVWVLFNSFAVILHVD